MEPHNEALNPDWALYAFCPLNLANEHSAKDYQKNSLSNSYNELVTGSRELTQETREHYTLQLSSVRSTYDLDAGNVTITRRLIRSAKLLTIKQATKAPSIIKVADTTENGSHTLTLKIPLKGNYMKLSKSNQNELRWHWAKMPELNWTGQNEDKWILQDYYTKKSSIAVGSVDWKLRNLDLWIYPQNNRKDALEWLAFTSPQAIRAEAQLPTLNFIPESTDAPLAISLSSKTFPTVSNGLAPIDIHYFPGLFLPIRGWALSWAAPMYPDIVIASLKSTYI